MLYIWGILVQRCSTAVRVFCSGRRKLVFTGEHIQYQYSTNNLGLNWYALNLDYHCFIYLTLGSEENSGLINAV